MLVLDGIYKERVFLISFPIKDNQERNTETRLRNTPKPTSLSLSFSDGSPIQIEEKCRWKEAFKEFGLDKRIPRDLL